MEQTYIKMDYSLDDPAAAIELVNKIIESTPPSKLTPAYLERLGKYIIEIDDTADIDSDNHKVTINDREMSFEGLVGKLENGEDGIYNMIANDKNIIFRPKDPLTAEDAENIPFLAQIQQAIAELRERSKTAKGRDAAIIHQQIIDLSKDQYVVRAAYKKPIYCMHLIKSMSKLDLSENITIDADGNVHSDGLINLFNEKHISALLCNYSRLKEDSWDKFNSDIKWLMMDLDNLIERNIKNQYPLYYDLIIYKIDGMQNIDIQQQLEKDHGIKHSVEYISSLWRNKIPKLLAEAASEEYLLWYYTTQERGKWKKCSRCGQVKLAHNKYFSKNSTSRDGYYSICKECRNKKN